jgi:iron(III) transport system substrate-binding protein
MTARSAARGRVCVAVFAVTGLLGVAACSSSSSNTSANSGGGGASSAGGGASSSPAASGAPAAQSLAAVCAAGTKEGELVTQRGTDADVFAKEMKPFEDKYNIKIKFTSLKPSDNAQQILAHVQAGKNVGIDATDFDLATMAPVLSQKGLIANVNWQALGVPKNLIVQTPQGIAVAQTDLPLLGVSYNPQKVNASEIPSTWEGLINSKWAGKIIVDPRGKYLAPLAVAWGAKKAEDWYGNLIKVDKPILVQGATDSLQKIVSGEALLSLSAHNAEVDQMKAETGAPLAIKYLDVVPASGDYAVIFNDAKHPNAARCYYGWRLSKAGLADIYKYEYKADSIPASVPKNTVSYITTTAQANLVTQVTNKFVQLAGVTH